MSKNLIFSFRNQKINPKEKCLLAGEWVTENIDQKIIEQYDYEIFKSSSHFKENRIINSYNSNIIYGKIIKDLSKNLNEIHSINLSIKSWKIIFGNWLKRFIDICFERNNLLFEILEKKEINQIYGIKSNYPRHSDKTLEIFTQASNEYWNNNLFCDLLNFYDLKVNKIFLDHESKKVGKTEKKKTNFIDKVKKFLHILKSRNNAVIKETYFPFRYEKLLEVLFFQFPSFNSNNKLKINEINKNLRDKISINIDLKKNIENFIRENIYKYLPKTVLEQFSDLISNCEKDYPKNPKFILTSISQEFDEYFKFYTALKVEQKTPYFILQHGNTYIVEDFTQNRVEFETPNNFFSFGIENKNKVIKGFCNHLTLGRKIKYNKKGFLHLLPSPILNRIFPYDRNIEFNNCLKLVSEFEKKISQNLKNKILLRLNRSFKNDQRGEWYFKKYFKNFEIKQIDFSKNYYFNNLKNSRVNIFFYDSTGILENLIYNIPTLGVWPEQFNHINSEFVQKYKLLQEAKILFDNVDDLIEHLSKFWQNIDEWWMSNNTQKLIFNFNNQFNNKPDLTSLLNLKKKILTEYQIN